MTTTIKTVKATKKAVKTASKAIANAETVATKTAEKLAEVKATTSKAKTEAKTEAVTAAQKAEELKKNETALQLAFMLIRNSDTLTHTALLLMQEHGYKPELDYRLNAVTFKATKVTIKNALEIEIAPFAIGDKSTSDKRYATIVMLISRVCNEGLNNGKAPTESKARTGTAKTPEKVISRQSAKIEAIELDEKDLEAMEQEIDFIGNIADFIEIYETELFKFIASDEDLLYRLLDVIKNGKKVAE